MGIVVGHQTRIRDRAPLRRNATLGKLKVAAVSEVRGRDGPVGVEGDYVYLLYSAEGIVVRLGLNLGHGVAHLGGGTPDAGLEGDRHLGLDILVADAKGAEIVVR